MAKQVGGTQVQVGMLGKAGQKVRRIFENPAYYRLKLAGLIRKHLQRRSGVVRCRSRGVLMEYRVGANKIEDKMFHGLFGLEVIVSMRRLLSRGGVFVDVGANIGYLSAVAAGLVGPEGEVHSFEPVPEYFERLQLLAKNNPQHRITVNDCAIGDVQETVQMRVCTTGNIGRNTIIGDWLGVDASREITVHVHRLDTYLRGHGIGKINLIKIDTEGYELPVLRGLSGYLEGTKYRPPIICEVTPKAARAFGSDPDGVRRYLHQYGYQMLDIFTWDLMPDDSLLRREESTFDVLFMALPPSNG